MSQPLRPPWWQRNALYRSRAARMRRARRRGRETFDESTAQAEAILVEHRPADACPTCGSRNPAVTYGACAFPDEVEPVDPWHGAAA